MLPRQCIYMLDHAPGSAGEAKWATRMGKLRKIILTPSLIIVWVLGLTMAITMGFFTEGWFHTKLTLVLAMTCFHGWLVVQTKKMARGERPLTEARLRMIGELPGLLLVLIVALVYLKPF
jgi:putative membrane protein